jgi:hypothetical protein
MTQKPQKTTTIEITMETYALIHSVQTKIEDILSNGKKRRKSLSADKIIKIVFAAKSIDLQISELMLEQ